MTAQLLIINPNTTESVSQTLLALGQQEAAGACQVRVQTARFGARYISDELSFAIAAHALLDAYAYDQAQPDASPPDAVLIGCFGDPGLLALGSLCACPVLGLAQASVQAAHARGRYAIITGGQPWVPMLARWVRELGLNDQLSGIWAVDKTGAQLAADTAAAVAELADLCTQVLAQAPATQVILLGGAALGGLAADIERTLARRGRPDVQVLDSVRLSLQVATQQAIAFARRKSMAREAEGANRRMACTNLSPELQQLLQPSARP